MSRHDNRWVNHALVAWLGVDYHQQMHRETGQSPHERYQEGARFTRHVDLNAVLSFFHRREQRTVDEDHSDVRVNNLLFAVRLRSRDGTFDEYLRLQPVDLIGYSIYVYRVE